MGTVVKDTKSFTWASASEVANYVSEAHHLFSYVHLSGAPSQDNSKGGHCSTDYTAHTTHMLTDTLQQSYLDTTLIISNSLQQTGNHPWL